MYDIMLCLLLIYSANSVETNVSIRDIMLCLLLIYSLTTQLCLQ